ncbi:hypothetical protein ABEB36_011408 [Hypothenemus hampei]|uniref:Uncharacterized protein n=1 Tax=Hypothenemus hampei TaxID=57062 RepID=A0ABD1EFB5_HYPHA
MILMKILFLIIMSGICKCQDYPFIDDIPIESYDHGDHQENDMDLELLPVRHGRSSPAEDDPKDYFFRSLRALDDFDDVRTLGSYQNIPRPQFQDSSFRQRRKRSTSGGNKTLSGIVKSLGEPLEIVPLEPVENKDTENSTTLAINDFIRFRRSPIESEQAAKLIIDSTEEDQNREARAAIQEHWTKQEYPVRKDEMLFSSSEHVRAPRVHFVTQNRLHDSRLAPSEFRPYERESRARYILDVEPRDLPPPPRRDDPYYRRYRSYEGPPSEREFYRDELYSRHNTRNYRHYYRPRYDNYEREPLLQKPQKRIIYYATLPEVSRSPPNVNLRDRYRDDQYRYDDRYLNDPYRVSKGYPKSAYEDEGKTPYPVKVLTDVNVREVKKNPERRIYSEADRNRYAYNTPPYRAEG